MSTKQDLEAVSVEIDKICALMGQSHKHIRENKIVSDNLLYTVVEMRHKIQTLLQFNKQMLDLQMNIQQLYLTSVDDVVRSLQNTPDLDVADI